MVGTCPVSGGGLCLAAAAAVPEARASVVHVRRRADGNGASLGPHVRPRLDGCSTLAAAVATTVALVSLGSDMHGGGRARWLVQTFRWAAVPGFLALSCGLEPTHFGGYLVWASRWAFVNVGSVPMCRYLERCGLFSSARFLPSTLQWRRRL